MKKSILALAVLGAFAGTAFAQTSVTVYGVADLGIARTQNAATPAARTTQMSGNGMMNNGNSRLGFRGTEDLGGGLKASFQFEQGINLETGATETPTYQRNANMSLGGTWGTFYMGRGLSTGFFAIAAYELTGAANYSVLANQFGFTGGTRNNSEFRYTSPNFNGFTAAVGHIIDVDNATADAETAINVIYRGGPIAAGLAYARLGAPAANGDDTAWSLGGSYNFGAFKVVASYHDPEGASKGFTLGGATTMGPVSLVLDVARQTGTGIRHTDYLVEAKYSLSKRTTAYAAFLREGAPNTAVGAGSNNIGIGVRHNF
jgi:predicted porin